MSCEETENVLNNLFPMRSITKMLLVNPPDVHASMFNRDAARRRRYANFPPYGLIVLAQHLREMGVDVRILNLHNDILKKCIEEESDFVFNNVWKSILCNEVHDFNPDLIGITCMFTMTHTSFKDVCMFAYRFNIPIAIGGVHVTNDVERVMDDIPEANIVFLQESDVAIKKFVQVVNGDSDELCQVIINHKGARHRYVNECQPNADEISIIPAYDLIDVGQKYGTIGAFHHLIQPETICATVISNRGCRASCTFCSVPNFNGRKVRQRTISSVISELELLKKQYGIGHFMWLDDDLFKDHKRIISLFNEMVRQNLDMTWDATNGVIAVSCTEEVISAASASGCIGLHIGMESGNPEMLLRIRKPGTVKNFLQAGEVLRKHEKIYSSVFVMIGFPGETMSMIWDTINVCREMDLDWYSIGQLQPLPNTPIYDQMVTDGLIQDSQDVRFTLGHHGKSGEIEVCVSSFDIETIHLDAIPTKEQLIDIWFYMDYYLNYHRLFSEKRPAKIQQQIKQLGKISDILYPDHAFALYFLGYLQKKMFGKTDNSIVQRLKNKLSESTYWQHRFEAFGLSVGDLWN